MNDEKEIEEMANAVGIAQEELGEVAYEPYRQIFEACVNSGIGNVKQAVKEFAEKLKDQMESNGYRSPLHNRIIDTLITELYGADE